METNTASTIISRLGGGSGIDMTQLANDLAETRFLSQIGQLESRSEALQARISAASTLRSQLSQLASALGDRIRNGDLAPSATLANPAVASARVAGTSTASGSYTLEVEQLANAQTLASSAYGASGDLAGEGELTIRFGTVAGGAFTEDTERTATTIAVEADDTLADVAAKISSSGSGLQAYVAQTSAGAQLVIKGETGAANGFVVEAAGASSAQPPAAGNINYLAWSPATGTGQLRTSAADARFLFDSIEMTSASNTVTGLPEGLSLTLAQTNIGEPTRIRFDDKADAITSMMNDFVTALNELAGSIAELAAPLGGELSNDPGARALKRELAALTTEIIMPNAAEGEPSTLADLGLARTRDGNFRIDSDRLRDTLDTNLPAAGAMFTTGLFGVFATIDNLSREVSRSTDPGSLGGSITRYTSQISSIDERLEKIADQQEVLRERLVRQFAGVDRNVTASQSTLSFLQNQIAVWNNSNGN